MIFPPHYNIAHTLYFSSQIIFLCDASLFFSLLCNSFFFLVYLEWRILLPFIGNKYTTLQMCYRRKNIFFFFIAYLLYQTLKLAQNKFFFFIDYQLYQTLKLAQSYSKFGTWGWTSHLSLLESLTLTSVNCLSDEK